MKHVNPLVPLAAAMFAVSFAHAGERHPTGAAVQEAAVLLAQGKAARTEPGSEMQKIHDHMKMMQQKMDRYHATKDQKERAKLRSELYADMRDHMKLMRGPAGMDSGQMMSGRAKQHQKMMEMRMDQMHLMMEWMFTFQSDLPMSPP